MPFIIDLSDPGVQQFILQGGAVIVALTLLVGLIVVLVNAQANRDKHDSKRDGEQTEIVKMLLTDFKTSYDKNTDAVNHLTDFIKADRERIDTRLARVESKVDGVIASVRVLSQGDSNLGT